MKFRVPAGFPAEVHSSAMITRDDPGIKRLADDRSASFGIAMRLSASAAVEGRLQLHGWSWTAPRTSAARCSPFGLCTGCRKASVGIVMRFHRMPLSVTSIAVRTLSAERPIGFVDHDRHVEERHEDACRTKIFISLRLTGTAT